MELIKAAPAIWFRIRPASQSRIAVHGTDYASRFQIVIDFFDRIAYNINEQRDLPGLSALLL